MAVSLRPSTRLLSGAALLVCLCAVVACGDAPPPAPAPPTAPVAAACPVCGDPVDPVRAVEVGDGTSRRSVCSKGCAVRFEASPEKFGSRR